MIKACCVVIHEPDLTYGCGREGTMEHAGKLYCVTHCPPRMKQSELERRSLAYDAVMDYVTTHDLRDVGYPSNAILALLKETG